jgi:hypothetical protein
MNALDLNDTQGPDRDGDGGPRQSYVSHEAKGLALAIEIAAIGLAFVTVLFVDGASSVTVNKPADCAPIADSDASLNCYDVSIHRAPSPPARGATAPGAMAR